MVLRDSSIFKGATVHRRIITLLTFAALLTVPALAIATPGNRPNNGNHGATGATGATGNNGANGNAYGRLCQNQSKQHVAGTPGTPFSQCVHAMRLLDTGKAKNPARACKGLSKKHVKGQKGTPFSRCVSAAAKLRGKHVGATGPTGATGATGATGPSGS